MNLKPAALLLFAATACLPVYSQIAPPGPGILFSYHYWPEQFVQFVGPELPYSMIAVEVVPGKKPIVAVTLTGRADHKRTLYSDQPAVVAAAAAQGYEAHQTALAWEESDTQTTGSVSTLRMSMADGKPLEWRFVQGSDVTEQGAGLSDLSYVPIPMLAYREQGAVAGEGTALKIGNVTSTADVWNEISHPPYFIAYHGALSTSAHTLTLLAGKENFTVVSPAALTAGSTWELTGEGGRHQTMKIVKVDGPHYTLDVTDSIYPAIHATMQATRTGETWQVDSLRFAPDKDGEKHFLTVVLTPAAMEVSVGKKNKIASGTLAGSGTDAEHQTIVTMQSPVWAKGKTMTEAVSTSATGESVVAHP